jgi:hypothetical protein
MISVRLVAKTERNAQLYQLYIERCNDYTTLRKHLCR